MTAIATTPAPALSDALVAEAYARQEALLRNEVAKLNEVLGLSDAEHKVTFGYYGNVDSNGKNDQRRWAVFLPHPGRVGTSEDRLGGFATGSLEGIVATRGELRSIAKGIALAGTAAQITSANV